MAMDEGQYDGKVDVWSIGITCIEMGKCSLSLMSYWCPFKTLFFPLSSSLSFFLFSSSSIFLPFISFSFHSFLLLFSLFSSWEKATIIPHECDGRNVPHCPEGPAHHTTTTELVRIMWWVTWLHSLLPLFVRVCRSEVFRDFISCCLKKEPDDRMNSTETLEVNKINKLIIILIMIMFHSIFMIIIIVYFIEYFSSEYFFYSIGLLIFPDRVILSSSWYRGLKMPSVGLITETLRDYRRCWWETKTQKWREMRLKVNHQGMGIWSMRVWVFELSEYEVWVFRIMRSRVRVFELQVLDIVKIFLFSFFPF